MKPSHDAHHADESEYLALSEASLCLALLVLTMAIFTPAAFQPARSHARPSLDIKTETPLVQNQPAPEGDATPVQATHRWTGRLEATGATADGAVIIEVSPEVFSALRQAAAIKLITQKP